MRRLNDSDKPTSQLIKEAAVKLFAKYGYDGTTVRGIAKMAGISAGQITVNFGSKENLFNEIVNDIYEKTCEVYDPLVGQYSYMKSEGILDEENVWKLIEKIVDAQIKFAFDDDNMDYVQIINIHMYNNDVKTTIPLAKITIEKIEGVMAELFQEVFKNKRYLHARTVSRMVNGSIISIAEHQKLLLDEVMKSKHMPQARVWFEGYVKDFAMGSIRSEALREEQGDLQA